MGNILSMFFVFYLAVCLGILINYRIHGVKSTASLYAFIMPILLAVGVNAGVKNYYRQEPDLSNREKFKVVWFAIQYYFREFKPMVAIAGKIILEKTKEEIHVVKPTPTDKPKLTSLGSFLDLSKEFDLRLSAS